MRRGLSIAALVFALMGVAGGQSVIRFGVLGLFHPRELGLSFVDGNAIRIDGLPQRVVLTGEAAHRHLRIHAVGNSMVVSGVRVSKLSGSARDGSPISFELAVPGKLRRTYLGTLTITASSGELIPVVSMDRELAVAMVVASEMPHDAPIEALKAQAVVTRSFLSAGARHATFEFCDTTRCQYLRSPDEITPRIRSAAEATRGLVLAWHDAVIPTLYSSRCCGHTRTLREAGMEPGNGYPYYAVECRWCRRNPAHWRTQLPANAALPGDRSESSRINFARQWGWSALPGDRFVAQRNAGGTRIEGSSIGHGLGLCQFGAIGMAAEGADFRSILAHYYPNTTLMEMSPQQARDRPQSMPSHR